MKELAIDTVMYLLIGLLGAAGLVLSLFSIGKASLSSHLSKTVVWSALAILCLCAIAFFGDSVETLRAFQIISQHVEAVIRGF
jgi:H+/gluconate symporter-like permease